MSAMSTVSSDSSCPEGFVKAALGQCLQTSEHYLGTTSTSSILLGVLQKHSVVAPLATIAAIAILCVAADKGHGYAKKLISKYLQGGPYDELLRELEICEPSFDIIEEHIENVKRRLKTLNIEVKNTELELTIGEYVLFTDEQLNALLTRCKAKYEIVKVRAEDRKYDITMLREDITALLDSVDKLRNQARNSSYNTAQLEEAQNKEQENERRAQRATWEAAELV